MPHKMKGGMKKYGKKRYQEMTDMEDGVWP